MGLSHCMVHALRQRLIALFRCLVSEGVRVMMPMAAAYSPPTHSVEPEEVTRGHHVTIKLLVAAWPESANFPHQPDDPDESNTVYNAVKTRGSSSCSATSSAYAPPASPLPPHCGLNYPHRRAMLALLF
jgi:hypothetical protein